MKLTRKMKIEIAKIAKKNNMGITEKPCKKANVIIPGMVDSNGKQLFISPIQLNKILGKV